MNIDHFDPKDNVLLFKIVDRLLMIVVSALCWFLEFIDNWNFIPSTKLKDPGQYYYSKPNDKWEDSH